MKFDVRVHVWLKPSVFDPQGHAVEGALHTLGYQGVARVRVGKYMELTVEAADRASAEAKVREMCERVLCNPVIETFDFSLSPAAAKDAAGPGPDTYGPDADPVSLAGAAVLEPAGSIRNAGPAGVAKAGESR
ncbi:MAG: phosphoribosylformylglycinamidine synthase subunit PurS [Alicyclobacillus sp.]|nr:phosphoribosylformylglycinamidine synthase subunit PurS [Alicyclobacillus sp.]